MFKLDKDSLLNCDIVSPRISYAEFSDEISKETKEKIVLDLNYGNKDA